MNGPFPVCSHTLLEPILLCCILCLLASLHLSHTFVFVYRIALPGHCHSAILRLCVCVPSLHCVLAILVSLSEATSNDNFIAAPLTPPPKPTKQTWPIAQFEMTVVLLLCYARHGTTTHP